MLGLMEVIPMIRDFKAPRRAVLLSSARYALLSARVMLPEIAAGIALLVLLLLLGVASALI